MWNYAYIVSLAVECQEKYARFRICEPTRLPDSVSAWSGPEKNSEDFPHGATPLQSEAAIGPPPGGWEPTRRVVGGHGSVCEFPTQDPRWARVPLVIALTQCSNGLRDVAAPTLLDAAYIPHKTGGRPREEQHPDNAVPEDLEIQFPQGVEERLFPLQLVTEDLKQFNRADTAPHRNRQH